MRSRHLASLGAASLLLLSSASVHAQQGAAQPGVTLRYHFVAGQHYAYAVTTTVTATVPGPSASINSTTVTHGSVSYQILHVDPAGRASARVHVSPIRVQVTVLGQTQQRVSPQQSFLITLGPDGSQQGSAHVGALVLAVQSSGALPAGPVAPGAHWVSHSAVNLPQLAGGALPPVHTTVQNSLHAVRHDHGQVVADIASTSSLAYVTDSALSGVPVHLHMTGTSSQHALLGLGSGHIVSSHVHQDLHLYIMARSSSAGAPQGLREHIVADTTISTAG